MTKRPTQNPVSLWARLINRDKELKRVTFYSHLHGQQALKKTTEEYCTTTFDLLLNCRRKKTTENPFSFIIISFNTFEIAIKVCLGAGTYNVQ
jgi:hypothetical protein